MGPQAVSSPGLTPAGGESLKNPELPWALDTLAGDWTPRGPTPQPASQEGMREGTWGSGFTWEKEDGTSIKIRGLSKSG